MRTLGPRHALLLIALVAAVFVVKPHAKMTRVYDGAACGPVRDLPAQHSRARVNAMVVCLLNYERSRHGLAPLVELPALDAASMRQSLDMVSRRQFEHVSPDGATPQDRIAATGYDFRPGGATGENIAWGEGTYGTPAEIVDGWMHSPGHRANILRPEFSQVGVGLTIGGPPGKESTRRPSATYTTDFGG